MVLSGPTKRFAAAATLVAMVALASSPVTARAVEPPPPALLPVLGARCDSAGLVRVETKRSSRFLHGVRFEADAVVLPGVKRAALIEVGTPPEKREMRIPWAEVERIELGRSRTAQGFLVGGLVGAAVGGVMVGAHGSDLDREGDNVVFALAVLTGVSCALLGAIVGAASPAWTPLYP